MMYYVYEVNYTGGQPGAGGHDDSYCMFNMRYAYSWESKENTHTTLNQPLHATDQHRYWRLCNNLSCACTITKGRVSFGGGGGGALVLLLLCLPPWNVDS